MGNKIKPPKKYGPSSIKKTPVVAYKPVEPTVSSTDPIYLFLDDERLCPEGWMCVRSPYAFREAVERFSDRIRALSLDWYLGPGVENGEDVVKRLTLSFDNDPNFLPNLEYVFFHSSDFSRAKKMRKILTDAIPDERDVLTTLHLPTSTSL